MTEQQPYRLVERFPEFELRDYPDYTLVECEVTGDFMAAGNAAFYPLVNYISGRNETGQKMAMTAPVLQETRDKVHHTVSFVLPAGMKPGDVPVPKDARVRVNHVAGHRAAVRSFGGSWKEARFMENAARLRAAVAGAGLVPEGDVYFARFDPPWKPGFLKKNEVLLRVAG